MSKKPQDLETLGDFLKNLEWHDYKYVSKPDLPSGAPPKELPTKKTEDTMETYRLRVVQWRTCVEAVRPGVVLFLQGGKFILVGHVNESLTSRDHFEPDFDYEDIRKIAYLW